MQQRPWPDRGGGATHAHVGRRYEDPEPWEGDAGPDAEAPPPDTLSPLNRRAMHLLLLSAVAVAAALGILRLRSAREYQAYAEEARAIVALMVPLEANLRQSILASNRLVNRPSERDALRQAAFATFVSDYTNTQAERKAFLDLDKTDPRPYASAVRLRDTLNRYDALAASRRLVAIDQPAIKSIITASYNLFVARELLDRGDEYLVDYNLEANKRAVDSAVKDAAVKAWRLK